jgi:hypothetical protein
MWAVIPSSQFENIFTPQLCIEISKQNFHVVRSELMEYSLQFLIKAVLYACILSWCMHIEKNYITPTAF